MGTVEADLIKALPKLLSALRVVGTVRRSPTRRGSGGIQVDVLTPLGRKRRLVVEARVGSVPSRIREALLQLKTAVPRSSDYPVLASTFLSPRVRQICREEGVGYLDLAGNSFLQFEDFYFEKVVDENPFPAKGRPASVFSLISSRIVRALLEEPQRTWTVSALSEATGVSLGQTCNVTRRLVGEEYVSRVDRRLQLTQPGRLLEAWREADRAPGRRTGFYSFEQEPQRLMARLAEIGRERGWRYAATSFSAASLIAPFVRGIGVVDWYVEDEAAVEGWVGALDLRPAESGPNAVLRIPRDAGVFYRARPVEGVTVVGNVQLYLDLFREPSRGGEQAEFLRKEQLRF